MEPNIENEHFRLIACPHILSMEKERIDVTRPPGGTITDLMRSIGWTPDGLSARVYLDGALVTDAAWEYTSPRAGQALVVRAIPMGGGGQGKDNLKMVAMIAVMVAGIAVSAGAFAPLAGALAGGGAWAGMLGGSVGALWTGSTIGILGALAVQGLIPAPLPRRAALPQPREYQEAA